MNIFVIMFLISETNLRLKDIYHHDHWNFSHLKTQIPFNIQLEY